MPMSWESYIKSQEQPEACPVCGADWCSEDGVALVPDHLIPYCSAACALKDADALDWYARDMARAELSLALHHGGGLNAEVRR